MIVCQFESAAQTSAAAVVPPEVTAASAQDALVGAYAISENGREKEFVRITKEGGRYFICTNEGAWSAPKELMPVPTAKYEMHFDKAAAGNIQGLGHKFVGIFKVPIGFKSGHYICHTGYAMAFLLGAIDLRKL